MIISHISDLAAAKRVEKVLAAVQQFLECGTNLIEKVAEIPSVFYDGKMTNTYVCRRPCTAVNAISAQPLEVTGICNLSGKRWGTDNFCFVLVETFFL